MDLKLVLLVAIINQTEAAVCSTNHMSLLIWLTSRFPRLPYRCMLPRLQVPLKVISSVEGGKQGAWGLMVRRQNTYTDMHRAPINEGHLGTRQRYMFFLRVVIRL